MLKELQKELNNKDIVRQLQILAEKFEDKIVFSTSFQYEDQVITDFIFRNNININIFTLDTGRHFSETLKTLEKTRHKYNKNINVFFPDTQSVEKLQTEKGAYSFYDSPENRKECCYIRKVVPLERALAGAKCWITGLRAGQSNNRVSNMHKLEWNEKYNLYKFNPLLDWTLDDVKQQILEYNIPYNVMHDKGFPSIGCEPCTRAIRPGEDIRAGRWWWEDNSKKECGLHVK